MKRYIRSKIELTNEDNNELYEILDNPNLRHGALAKLAESSTEYIREGVAQHPNVDSDTLDKLVQDPEFMVCYYALSNPNTPEAILRKAVDYATNRGNKSEESGMKSCIAKHNNTPADILDRLSMDWSISVRTHVAKNPNTSVDTLLAMARSPIEDRWVKAEVVQNLLNRGEHEAIRSLR